MKRMAIALVLAVIVASALVEADAYSCHWSQTDSKFIDPVFNQAVTVTSQGSINADGSGGGSGDLDVFITGPWYQYSVIWSVVNAAGQTIASGSYTNNNPCNGNEFSTQWSGSGTATTGLLKVQATTLVSGQGDIFCTFSDGDGEFDQGSQTATSGDCPVS